MNEKNYVILSAFAASLGGLLFGFEVWWESFDPNKFMETFHDIGFYEKEWAKFKFAGATDKDKIRNFGHVDSLPVIVALPLKTAVTFFYGSIAIARDVRITESDIFAPVNIPENMNFYSIRPIKAPEGIWKAWELDLRNGEVIHFCDFSSAGNTWDNNSEFNTLEDK